MNVVRYARLKLSGGSPNCKSTKKKRRGNEGKGKKEEQNKVAHAAMYTHVQDVK